MAQYGDAKGEEMGAEGYRPADAAATLGVPASTLRLYSVRFGPLLSAEAARPIERAGGRPGFRLYSEQDLAVLREGKALLEKGSTYDEALRELRRRWRPRLVRPVDAAPQAVGHPVEHHSAEPQDEPPPRQRTTGGLVASTRIEAEREQAWTALVGGLVSNLNSAQALAEEWRRLVEDRNAEIATLRRRLREAEEAARAPWWRRLLGG